MQIISSNTKLHELHDCLRNFFIHHKTDEYRFELPEWNEEENRRASIILTSYSKECGCNTGSFFMSLAFALSIIVYFASGGKFYSIGMKQMIWLGVITFSGAIVGKLTGLLYARWKMIQLTGKILSNMNQKEDHQISTNN